MTALDPLLQPKAAVLRKPSSRNNGRIERFTLLLLQKFHSCSYHIVTEEILHNLRLGSNKMDTYLGSSPKKLVECRICHDEDQDSSMETPCGCCGSLEYAHRRCVQRWCNEKGNTICEICLQQFKPGYTSRPQLFCYGGFPMNFRGNWEISGRAFYNLEFSAMVATNHDSLESDFDEYIDPSSRSLLCCRIVAISFIILLVLRYTLPILINGGMAYSITTFMLYLLSFIGILLLTCIMASAYTAAQHHQQQLDHHDFMPDEENNLPQTESQPRMIHVR